MEESERIYTSITMTQLTLTVNIGITIKEYHPLLSHYEEPQIISVSLALLASPFFSFLLTFQKTRIQE